MSKLPKFLLVVACATTTMWCSAAHAVVVATDDFDGGMNLTSRTFDPDNTAFNGLFGENGSRFDRFGIANVTVEDAGGADLGLPFDIVDASAGGFANDAAGIVSEFKTDNFFVSVDIENGSNTGSVAPGAKATWEFDVSGHENLSLNIDMAMLGGFSLDDTYTFSYSIDGGTSETAFLVRVRGIDDGAGGEVEAGDQYVVKMDNGNEFVGAGNSFYSNAEWSSLTCELGVTNSCLNEVPGDDADGFEFWRPALLDADKDGHVYYDNTLGELSDTQQPDDSLGPIRMYEDENSNGTFQTPSLTGPNENPLTVNNDQSLQLTNQLAGTDSTRTAPITGTGSTLTLVLDAISNGGNQYFVFDNIVIEGTPTGGGGLSCDFNDDTACDATDIDLLYANFGAVGGEFDVDGSGTVDGGDVAAFLASASDPTNTYLGGAKTFVLGDVDLNGTVDSTDLGLLLNNFGNATGLLYGGGNLNDDANVDSTDLGLLLNNFGFESPAAAAAVPEPATGGLLLLALCGFLARRKQR